MVNKYYEWLRSLLPPPRCLLCEDVAPDAAQLCRRCLADLPWIGSACKICSKPLSIESICGECLQKSPVYSRAFVPLRYAYPVDHLIQRLKFSEQLAIAGTLSAVLAGAVGRDVLPQLLVPVPMHKHKLRERGFNQATEIARHLSDRTGVPLNQTMCLRLTSTPPQSSLKARARRRNVRGVFGISHMPRGTHHVAIVDDVVTTGATVEEMARVLRKAGVSRIDVWACARTETKGWRR